MMKRSRLPLYTLKSTRGLSSPRSSSLKVKMCGLTTPLYTLIITFLITLFIMYVGCVVCTPHHATAAPPEAKSTRSGLARLPHVVSEIDGLTRRYLDPAIRKRENRFIFQLNEGRLHYFKEDYRNAAMTLLELVETYRSQRGSAIYKDALFYLADSLYHIGNLRTAARFFEQVVKLKDPKMMPCALGRLLEISTHDERYQRVQKYLQSAIRYADSLKESDLYYILGKYSFHTQRYRQAIRFWDRVSRFSSTFPQARYFRGVALLSLGDLKGALEAFKEVRALDLKMLKLAVDQTASEEDIPEVDLRTGSVINSPAPPTSSGTSSGASSGSPSDTARTVRVPSTAQARVTGCTFRSAREREDEVKGWELVRAHAQLGVARIYYETGELDEALSAYLEVERDSPLFRDAIEESVWVSIKQGNYKIALQQMDVQLIDVPDILNDPYTRLLQGRLLSILGRFSDAQSIFGELKTRFETFKSSALTPILVRAKGQLAAYFQRKLESGMSMLNLEALLPRAALQFTGRELSSKAARELFVEIAALKRDINFSKDTIRDLYWVLDSPNQSEIFPQLHEGLLRALELRYQLFNAQIELNDQVSISDRKRAEYQALKRERRRASDALEGLPQTKVQLQEREAQVERKLMLADLKLFRLKMGLKHHRAQLIALKSYLTSAEPDEVIGVLTPQQRSSALTNVEAELRSYDEQVSKIEVISEEIKRTTIRVGIFDEAFMIEEGLRTDLARALDRETEWLAARGRVSTERLAQIERAHHVIEDFQQRCLQLVSENSSQLRDQVAQEELKIRRYERQLKRLSNQAQRLAGQMVAQTLYRVLKQLDLLILEADAGLLDMIWTQKNKSSDVAQSERDRRQIHFEVLERDLVE